MKKLILFAAVMVSLVSCKKETSPSASPEDIKKAADFNASIMTGGYSLKQYFSDVPIDYIDTDAVVKSETDLWDYVSAWVKDDTITFDANTAHFQQGKIMFESETSPTIDRSYKIGADKDGVYMDFVNHQYQPLKYRLVSYDNTGFLVSASWNNKTVKSRFSKN